MKKLVAAVLTGVLVAGTLSTGVMQRMMTRPLQLQHLQHLTQRSLRRQNRFLRKKEMNLKLLYLMTM